MERRESADSGEFENRFLASSKRQKRHVQFRLVYGKPEFEKENQYDVCRPFFNGNLSDFLDASTLWVSLKNANDCKEVLVLDRCTQLVSLLEHQKGSSLGEEMFFSNKCTGFYGKYGHLRQECNFSYYWLDGIGLSTFRRLIRLNPFTT